MAAAVSRRLRIGAGGLFVLVAVCALLAWPADVRAFAQPANSSAANPPAANAQAASSLRFASRLPERDYWIAAATIDAVLREDGTLEVSESRRYEFDGEFNGVRQKFGLIGSGMGVDFEGASVQTDGGVKELRPAEMMSKWREDPASAPKGYATFDERESTFYAFHAFEDETATITFRYSIAAAGRQYRDTAELYWKFVSDGWDVPNEFVDLTLALPVPKGESAVAGDNVLVYGHGPFDGEIGIDDGKVRAVVPLVGTDEFAEVRVLFPRDWLSLGAGAPNVFDANRRAEAIEEEASFVTREQEEARMRVRAEGGSLGVLAAIVAGAGALFRRYGKEYRPVFQEKYWRDVPDPDLHPAVVARLHSWGDQSQDIPVSLLHLANIGAIQLLAVPDEKGRYGRHGDWAIVRTENAAAIPMGEIDSAVMRLVFDTVGRGRKRGTGKTSNRRVLDAMIESGAWRGCGSATGIEFDPVAAALVPARSRHEEEAVLFSDFRGRAKAAPSKYAEAVEKVHDAVSGETDRENFFEGSGTWLQIGLWLAAPAVGALGYLVGSAVGLPWHYWAGLSAGALAIVGFAWFMRRRTPPANEINAKCEALKRWLADFSRLDEAPPSDVKKWGEMMVYAAAFGVADDALRQLREIRPEVASDPGFLATGYWIGSMDSMRGAGGGSAFDAFGDSMRSAQAVAVEGSSGGGGGGFGGGGGGGAF